MLDPEILRNSDLVLGLHLKRDDWVYGAGSAVAGASERDDPRSVTVASSSLDGGNGGRRILWPAALLANNRARAQGCCVGGELCRGRRSTDRIPWPSVGVGGL